MIKIIDNVIIWFNCGNYDALDIVKRLKIIANASGRELLKNHDEVWIIDHSSGFESCLMHLA